MKASATEFNELRIHLSFSPLWEKAIGANPWLFEGRNAYKRTKRP